MKGEEKSFEDEVSGMNPMDRMKSKSGQYGHEFDNYQARDKTGWRKIIVVVMASKAQRG